MPNDKPRPPIRPPQPVEKNPDLIIAEAFERALKEIPRLWAAAKIACSPEADVGCRQAAVKYLLDAFNE